ncbi:MAG: ThiF family adenylyltransferase, partial [Planctomycetota bacterium]
PRARRRPPAAPRPAQPARAANSSRGHVAPPPAPSLLVHGLPPELRRYQRQMILPAIGRPGQERLARAVVAVVGLGALGSVSADYLARAGVGRLILIDRDCLELTNLQRQVLYTEADVAATLPKAVAAARALARINSGIELEDRVADLTAGGVEALAREVDLIVDGTDNFDTRYLLNDACVKHGKPWIYGAAVGAAGLGLSILPGVGPCLRCLFEQPPPVGAAPTCDTVGVLGPLTGIIGAWQAGQAIKLLAAGPAAVSPRLISIDLWTDELRAMNARDARRKTCPCCGKHRFDFLSGRHKSADAVLCAREGVQISAPPGERLDLERLAARLRRTVDGDVELTPYLCRFRSGEIGVTVFHDGRAIFQGTTDIAHARSLHARILGH